MRAPEPAKKAIAAAMTAWLALCGLGSTGGCQTCGGSCPELPGVQSALLTPARRARLASYEAAISGGDPAAASAFLADKDLLPALAGADPEKEESLKILAGSLTDLKALLAMRWDDAGMNGLSQALALRMDAGKPLSRAGVGPEPEKLLSWLGKYQPSYPAGKTAAVKKAIRQWEVVFGSMTETMDVQWGQARGVNGLVVSRSEWRTWTLGRRNAVLARIVKENPGFLAYDDAALAEMKNEISLARDVDEAIRSGALTRTQIERLAGGDLQDQVYLLGSFFDGSNVSVNPDLETRIDAARDSMPGEVLPAGQRALLGTMLNTAVAKELAGTAAGEKVLAFYSGGAKLNITVRPCDGAYSRYDSASGAIQLDSENIQQYMRVKGYTADSLLKNREQLREVAEYVSPQVVYEAGHQMSAARAAKAGLYAPHVQEDEIEAMSLEGLYTSGKMRSDSGFSRLFTTAGSFSSYASKKLEIATEYGMSGRKKFASTVRRRYCPGLLSLDAAASQVLEAVTAELGRRAALAPEERAGLYSGGLSLAEAMEMTPAELSGSAAGLDTPALEKLRKDLSDLSPYKAGYRASDSETRKALQNPPVREDSGPRGFRKL